VSSLRNQSPISDIEGRRRLGSLAMFVSYKLRATLWLLCDVLNSSHVLLLWPLLCWLASLTSLDLKSLIASRLTLKQTFSQLIFKAARKLMLAFRDCHI
jgi:hypothetical protein